MKQLIRFALLLGNGGTGALDIGTSTTVASFEKHHASPDVDRFLILTSEIQVQAGEQQTLDLRSGISGVRHLASRSGCSAQRV